MNHLQDLIIVEGLPSNLEMYYLSFIETDQNIEPITLTCYYNFFKGTFG